MKLLRRKTYIEENAKEDFIIVETPIQGERDCYEVN
jgi:hypothetical protein